MELNFQPVAGMNRSLLLKKSGCGCGSTLSNEKLFNQEFVTGRLNSPSGIFPVISTVLKRRDRWRHFKARTSSFRNNFSVIPGLYAAGNPLPGSDVFVTANYGMSFNYLRQALNGMDAWVLVLDTNGINVWCAAGKGTFGTGELVSRVKSTCLDKIVNHRKLIVPQLGAPGVNATEVQKQTGFRVIYGPVRASDIKDYINNNYSASADMRQVRFGFIDRLVLVPMEVIPALKKYPYFFIGIFIIFGFTPDGIIFRKAIIEGLPFYTGGLLAVFTGAVLTPLLLPFIPFRSFSLKGIVSGLIVFLPSGFFLNFFGLKAILIQTAFVILFTAISSYLAVQFTGATTFTHISGVKKELRSALPFYIVTVCLSFILIICNIAGDFV